MTNRNIMDSLIKRDDDTKHRQLFVTLDSMYNTSIHPTLHQMPLSLDNTLPLTVLVFGTLDMNEIAFSCHLDSCAAMNTGNSLLHIWIMTEYPEIVDSYE